MEVAISVALKSRARGSFVCGDERPVREPRVSAQGPPLAEGGTPEPGAY